MQSSKERDPSMDRNTEWGLVREITFRSWLEEEAVAKTQGND